MFKHAIKEDQMNYAILLTLDFEYSLLSRSKWCIEILLMSMGKKGAFFLDKKI
jgi:hypothetical protein